MKKAVMHITINQGPLRGNTITEHTYPALCGTTMAEFTRSHKMATNGCIAESAMVVSTYQTVLGASAMGLIACPIIRHKRWKRLDMVRPHNSRRGLSMGRSYTPTYRLEFNDGSPQQQAWKGKANAGTLERWVFSYSKSLELGGVNQHISLSLGRVPYPNKARIVRQATGEVVTEWKAGMFQVY